MTDELSTLKRAYLALEEMEARLEQAERATRQPVAIVGIGCRLPGGADGPDAYWRLLADGVDAVTEIPADRWNVDDYYDPDPERNGTMATRWGGFLSRIDEFDASLFGISPREAAAVDPQQRLVLEVAWEALEDAGVAPDSLSGSATGVFLGVVNDDYRRLSLARGVDAIDAYYGAGTAPSVASGRLSFALGLQGPSLTVDTACSSSLVAVHLACASLRAGESDLVLAGGVNAILLPEVTVALSKLHMMAADGRCKAFDARADGFVRGEGCGIVALKRLSDAVAAGDPIHAVIRGSALNQDGPASGITVPNGPAQEAVVRAALADAGVAPGDVSYVEAHGTGTALGDPIELRALASALGAGRDPARPLLVGSGKTNLGHLESAAGIAGLIKAALAVERRQIPPHLHLREPNPHVPWERLPLAIPTDLQAWPAGAPLLAGASSFGFSGTNAHVVLEAAPSPAVEAAGDDRRPVHVLPLAAADGQALRALAGRYEEETLAGAELADVAHAAATGRAHLARRLAVVADGSEAARAALGAYAAGDADAAVVEGPESPEGAPRVAFLFTGQGAQHPGMGRALYETSPIFRDALDRCDAHLRGLLDRSLLSVLFEDEGDAIHATGWSQPALVSLELALAELWASWGVRPAAVLGHSVGEYAAVCVAGACSVEDALTLVATRATLMQALPEGGAMAAVRADEDVVRDALREAGADAVVAAVNGPASVVVSGGADGVAAVCALLAGAGIESRPLTVSHAFHSPRVDPMLDAFEGAAANVTFAGSDVRVVSSVTGEPIRAAQLADPGYWRRQVREPVRFADAVASLRGLGYDAFVEIGPAPTLLGMARECLPDEPMLWLPSLRPGRDDWRELGASLARLYAHGAAIDWRGFDAPYARRRVALPTYPFQRRRHWLDSPLPTAPAAGGHPLLGRRLRSSLPSALWDAELDPRTLPVLDDHRVRGEAILPAAAYVEMALSAAEGAGLASHEMRELVLVEPLVVPDGETRPTQLVLTPQGDGATFAVSSLAGEDWRRHAEGVLAPASAASPPCALDELRASLPEAVDGADHYASLAARGLDFGPSLHGVASAHRRDGEALARIELPEPGSQSYRADPALVDACLQAIAIALPASDEPALAFLPVSIGVVRLVGDPADTTWAHARVRASDAGDTLRADVVVRDEAGRPLLELLDIVLRPARESLRYRTAWREAPLPPEQPAAAGSWLVLGDRGGVGERLVAAVERAGGRAWLGSDPADPRADGIVDLRALDASSADEVTADPAAAGAALCAGVVGLIRSLVDANRVPPGGLTIVTEGAQPVGIAGEVPTRIALEQSSLAGLVRTVELEHAEVNVSCVDLDPYALDLDGLVRELGASERETLVAQRRGKRYVARLEASPAPGPAAEPVGARRLVAGPDGLLDSLSLVAEEVPRAREGEVVVRCDAAGLNFRDVLNGLAVREDREPLGSECCGTVVEVGPGVRDVEPGQQVVAIAPGALAGFAVARASLVAPRPRGATVAEAGSFPIAFLTAAWALDDVAGLRPGEDVLVHAGAGGVGLAAVQLALRAGARVFATAGTPGKRRLLERLGVAGAFDSRSLAFADEVRAATGGRGVDVVLNSLAGDAIPASLSTLAESGRLVELGKRDIWSAERVHEVRPDVAYTALDLSGRLLEAEPAVARRFAELVGRLDAGELQPLPALAVPLQEATSAFRAMAQGRHTGKLVLTDGPPRSAGIRADATYLVTGGLGGLGLVVCEWLVQRGAGSIVLTGRRQPSAAALELIDRLAAGGASIRAVQSDVSDPAAVAAVLDLIDRELPPLAGVVHAAGVLDDAAVTALDRQSFDTVFGPKVAGAWNLHEQTRGRDLDLFVLFSSVASVLGARGQGNYAAANAFLDALAHHRVALGLPALALDWGAWAGAGLAAEPAVAERLRAQGLGAIAPDVALRALEHELAAGAAQTAVLRVDWTRFAAGGASWLRAVTEAAPSPTRVARADGTTLRARLEKLPERRRRETTEAFVREHAASVLRLAPEEVSDRRPLQELGLDSLMAVELRNALGAGLGLEQPLPASLVFDYPTVAALSEHVLVDILGEGAPRAAATESPDDLLAAIEDISDDELDRLLATRLGEEGDA